MNIQHTETIWLNEVAECSFEHLAEVSGLTVTELQQLVDLGVIVPANQKPEHCVFQMDYIVIARKARRLRDDFELDLHGMAVALQLLQRIQQLELELAK
ncbi:MAG: chaperone modulator CbpM [Gammaproteobacteria bacterium]